MRIKLDENIGKRGEKLLRDGGCDVATVVSQDLCGTPDSDLAEICKIESRVLITLDKHFANILRFPPQQFAGIVVLRLPEPLTLAAIEEALRRFLVAARNRNLKGRLWIVEPRRIRELDFQENQS